eukprot:CAMPEP_0183719552 /NCGR_PEP_ID=MMETSP0737-20130205/12437_1 /TAXON_ID=385413 /ORGANISM="Thalassiosira miniscula, Strain CCMP1093" /LENGTH=44 /DNA_ID= /DNA_START= /DNA_END= /DNA_ORIENTATION=
MERWHHHRSVGWMMFATVDEISQQAARRVARAARNTASGDAASA